jgi:hypothetical protein
MIYKTLAIGKGKFRYSGGVSSSCPTNYCRRVTLIYIYLNIISCWTVSITRGRRGHGRMVVGFTTTYAISAYHH